VDGLRKICSLTGLPPLSDPARFVQMAAVPLPDTVDVDLLKVRLYEKVHIEVPVFQWKDRKLIRISVQGYNTKRDVNKLVVALKSLI